MNYKNLTKSDIGVVKKLRLRPSTETRTLMTYNQRKRKKKHSLISKILKTLWRIFYLTIAGGFALILVERNFDIEFDILSFLYKENIGIFFEVFFWIMLLTQRITQTKRYVSAMNTYLDINNNGRVPSLETIELIVGRSIVVRIFSIVIMGTIITAFLLEGDVTHVIKAILLFFLLVLPYLWKLEQQDVLKRAIEYSHQDLRQKNRKELEKNLARKKDLEGNLK